MQDYIIRMQPEHLAQLQELVDNRRSYWYTTLKERMENDTPLGLAPSFLDKYETLRVILDNTRVSPED